MSGGPAASGVSFLAQGGNYSATALQEAFQSLRGQKRGDAGTQWGTGQQQQSKARGAEPQISFRTTPGQGLGVGAAGGVGPAGQGQQQQPGGPPPVGQQQNPGDAAGAATAAGAGGYPGNGGGKGGKGGGKGKGKGGGNRGKGGGKGNQVQGQLGTGNQEQRIARLEALISMVAKLTLKHDVEIRLLMKEGNKVTEITYSSPVRNDLLGCCAIWNNARPDRMAHPDGPLRIKLWETFWGAASGHIRSIDPTNSMHDPKEIDHVIDQIDRLLAWDAAKGLHRFYQIFESDGQSNPQSGSEPRPDLYVLKFAVTQIGQDGLQMWQSLQDTDLFSQEIGAWLRDDTAPKGGLTRAIEEGLRW